MKSSLKKIRIKEKRQERKGKERKGKEKKGVIKIPSTSLALAIPILNECLDKFYGMMNVNSQNSTEIRSKLNHTQCFIF